MATQPLERHTLEHYLQIEDGLEYRSEFHDGVILPVEDATFVHSCLETAVGSILKQSFRSCAVCGSSLNIYIASANKIVHPDATVICGTPNYPKPNCIDNPTVVAEITSPATKDYDHGTKRELYFSLPSVQHYLLVSQTDRKVGHFERSGARWIYMDHDSGSILVGDAELAVGEIYADILV